MITRIYADNYRCLVNFTVDLESINLINGRNGSGKTSVFDVLRFLQRFILDRRKLTDKGMLKTSDRTRWSERSIITFGVELKVEDLHYVYRVELEQSPGDRQNKRVASETLHLNGAPLFESQHGLAQLYNDRMTSGPKISFDWTSSGLGNVNPRPDNQKLVRFTEELAKVIVVGCIPQLMERESQEEDARLLPRAENFVSWYRGIVGDNNAALNLAFRNLRDIIPHFESLSLKNAGEGVKILKVDDDRYPEPFPFDDLSDGQKTLCFLYILLEFASDNGSSIFIDEPDNFVALREIQPWLLNIRDACGHGLEQSVLISHHPEIINYLGGDHGRWFHLAAGGYTEVENNPKDATGILPLSEQVARGWLS